MQEDPQAGRLDTQISTLQSGQKRLQKRGLPAFAGSQAGRGFWQVVVAVVVSARWRVVRSLLGLDPKLPLLWSTDLGNVGERDEIWVERGESDFCDPVVRAPDLEGVEDYGMRCDVDRLQFSLRLV